MVSNVCLNKHNILAVVNIEGAVWLTAFLEVRVYLQQLLSVVPTKCLTGNLATPAYSSLSSASQLCGGIALSR